MRQEELEKKVDAQLDKIQSGEHLVENIDALFAVMKEEVIARSEKRLKETGPFPFIDLVMEILDDIETECLSIADYLADCKGGRLLDLIVKDAL